MSKPRRVAVYTRVSTDGQSVENQRRELLAVAERRGWEVVQEYSDHGISGAKDRDKRPAFDRMLKGATRREFDMIAAWSVDRLCRSLQHLVAFLGEVHAAGSIYICTFQASTLPRQPVKRCSRCSVFLLSSSGR